MKPTVLVIYGGTSSERAVSLRSGAAVVAGLRTAGFTVTEHDYDGTLPTALSHDIVFPVLHGAGGEDGQIQRQLDAIGVSYIGSSVTASELYFDKHQHRTFLKTNDVTVADGALVGYQEFLTHPLSDRPFVLKPHDGGSSVDTVIARDPRSISTSVLTDCFDRHERMLLEELIDGIEITVAVLGDEALPVVEIIPPINGEFDYENKYNGATTELCPPRHVSRATQQAAQALALRIHRACGCRDFSRTDLIVSPSGDLIVLETNTIPGMTDQSLLPKAAAAHGYDFPDLAERLVLMAWARR